MYVDKQTVISLLDDSDEGKYSAYLILLNEIPDDAMFTIVFYTMATAVYMNPDGAEDMRFPLKFDILTKEDAEYNIENIILNERMEESLEQDSEVASRPDVLGYLICFIVVASIPVVLYLLSIGYDIFIK